MTTVPTDELERLRTEIHQLKRTAERDAAETVVEIGRRLATARGSLREGAWGLWVAEELPFSRTSAHHYLALFLWSEQQPGHFQRLKVLGPTKLYAVARLAPERVADLDPAASWDVPGTDRRRSLELMSVPDFYALVATWLDAAPAPARIGRLVGGYRQRIRRLEAATDALVTRRVELDRVQAEELVTALRNAAARLERSLLDDLE